MKKIIISLIIIILVGFGFYVAQQKTYAFEIGVGEFKTEITDPDVPYTDLDTTIGSLVNIIITVAEIAFIILFLVGGIMYLTAAGNEENSKKARALLLEAVIGMVIVLAAWAVSTWIIAKLKDPNTGTGGIDANSGQDINSINDAFPSPSQIITNEPPVNGQYPV